MRKCGLPVRSVLPLVSMKETIVVNWVRGLLVQALQRGKNAARDLEPREVPSIGNDQQERAR